MSIIFDRQNDAFRPECLILSQNISLRMSDVFFFARFCCRILIFFHVKRIFISPITVITDIMFISLRVTLLDFHVNKQAGSNIICICFIMMCIIELYKDALWEK